MQRDEALRTVVHPVCVRERVCRDWGRRFRYWSGRWVGRAYFRGKRGEGLGAESDVLDVLWRQLVREWFFRRNGWRWCWGDLDSHRCGRARRPWAALRRCALRRQERRAAPFPFVLGREGNSEAVWGKGRLRTKDHVAPAAPVLRLVLENADRVSPMRRKKNK